MDERTAIEALAGLAQEHRLRVFRLLVREGPVGLPAGEIAQRLGVRPRPCPRTSPSSSAPVSSARAATSGASSMPSSSRASADCSRS